LKQYLLFILDEDGAVILKRGVFESHRDAVAAMAQTTREVMAVVELPEEISAKIWLSDSSEILVEENK